VVGGDLLRGLDLGEARFGVGLLLLLEDDEVPDEVKEGRGVEHALDEDLDLTRQLRGFFGAVDGLPCLEPAEGR